MIREWRLIGLATFLLISITTSSVSANTDLALSVRERYEGTMIDAHAHPVEWSSFWMVKTLETYHKAGVDKVIFFDGSQALQAHRQKPNDIVPSLYVRYMNRTSSVRDVESALKMGFMWIGEALLRHWGETSVAADDPVALQIYDLAAKYQVPITIHQDAAEYSRAYEELERALKQCPNTTFVFHGWWLGRGSLQRVQDLERLIMRHSNLYVELAGELEYSPGPPWSEQAFLGGTGQDLFAYPNGRIREEWRNIFEKYPARFINGFDLFTESAYELENLKIRVDYWRNLLGQISPDAAEKIAYRNVEDLLAHRLPISTTVVSTTLVTATSPTRATSVTITTATLQAHPSWTQTNWEYIAIAAVVAVVAVIIIARRRRRKEGKQTAMSFSGAASRD